MGHYTGGCQCGAIRYEISADPVFAGHCHCRDCQRATGTGHSSLMGFPEQAVKLSGTPRYYEVRTDRGGTAARGFCPTCGSPVVGRSTGFPGILTIMAGSLDDPSQFKPGAVVYAKRAQAWDPTDPALARFPEMPPM